MIVLFASVGFFYIFDEIFLKDHSVVEKKEFRRGYYGIISSSSEYQKEKLFN